MDMATGDDWLKDIKVSDKHQHEIVSLDMAIDKIAALRFKG
jgi:hypothetical protein